MHHKSKLLKYLQCITELLKLFQKFIQSIIDGVQYTTGHENASSSVQYIMFDHIEIP